jgi:hypothetical protein
VTGAATAGDAGGLVLLALAVWLTALRPGGRRARLQRIRSMIWSHARLRLSSTNPALPAASGAPSHGPATASPGGLGTTGPDNQSAATEMTGVPTG